MDLKTTIEAERLRTFIRQAQVLMNRYNNSNKTLVAALGNAKSSVEAQLKTLSDGVQQKTNSKPEGGSPQSDAGGQNDSAKTAKPIKSKKK